MTEDTEDAVGWFADATPADVDGSARAIRDGEARAPRAWPELAVESDAVGSTDEYYDWLHEATLAAAQEGVRARERADDRQLVHAVRAMDDCRRTANELAERVAEWGSDRLDATGAGVDFAREVANYDVTDHEVIDGEPADPTDERLAALATRCVDLHDEAEDLREFIERAAPDVAPNLAAMAGPVLATRLIALAGGLESLAKQPSGTVQVLGAEDALFAHLRGDGPSPKHGVIYTHEYVRGIDPEHRGSAARAVAGKFAIAARVDHYGGERKPELDAELDERIATIRARSEGGDDDGEHDGEEGDGVVDENENSGDDR